MYGFFDYFLVRMGEVFFNFAVKGVVGELAKSFFLVEVGAPNDYRAIFVSCFDSNVFALNNLPPLFSDSL